MTKYIVTLAHANGEVTEKEYITGWDIKKEGVGELIAESCAAETTIASGRLPDNKGYKIPCQGLSARLAA